jgi:hypothetical protein
MFLFLAGVLDTAEEHLLANREYLREFSKKFKTVLMGYSGARGKLIHEKNLMLKISCQRNLKTTATASIH